MAAASQAETANPAAAGGDAAASASPAETVDWRVWIGFIAMGVGMFMAMLDLQIVTSSLPEIQAGLFAGADQVSWVQTSYLMAEVIMIPLSGYLARMMSTHVLFTLSALGFTAMSIACAFASSIEAMIVFRALQGFAGGAMIPLVFATGFTLFHGPRQATVSVVIAMIVTLAPAFGPSLGGYITESLSWRWLFLVNVVPGLLVAASVWAFIRVDRSDYSLLRSLDTAGLVLMAVFLGSLQFILEEGPADDWFEDRTITGVAGIAAISGALFFARVLRYAEPIVDLRAFANRNFAIGALVNFTLGVGLWGALYMTPLFLAWVRGYNSLQIGVVMIVTGVAMMISGPIARMMAVRMDSRTMLGIGLVLLTVSIYWNSRLTVEADFHSFLWPQFMRGLSLMICLLPANALALGTLPVDKLKNASGLYYLMHGLGGAIALAAIDSLLIARTAFHESRLADLVNLGRPTVQLHMEALAQTLVARGGDGSAALQLVADMVTRQATVLAFNDAFLYLAGCVALMLGLLPFVSRRAVAA